MRAIRSGVHRPALALAVACLLAASALPARAASHEPSFGPRPSWVRPLEPAAPTGRNDLSGGVEYLVVDDQVRVSDAGAEEWVRRVRRISSLQGVDGESQFQIDWDPSHETLRIHRIAVRRDGREIDRTDEASVEVVRREPAFEASLLDGTLSALVLLPDVRVGDVVEHEYTITGRNPLFGDRWFGGFSVGWTVAVRRQGFRLTWPQHRRMRWRAQGIEVDPELRAAGTEREARWTFEDPPLVEIEGDEPSWFVPGGTVAISEFESWEEVARWAAPLYDAGPAGPELLELAQRIRDEFAAPEERVLAAIRFVQDDVRYLGLEIGTGTHAPTQPEVVLQRRFGDCKDKVLLLVALLRELGVTAEPGLVSTAWREELVSRLPSPGVFDHVIVRIELDGRTAWVDATISAQRGGLSSRHVPRFGKALLVREDANDLVDVVPAADDAPRTDVEARYVLPEVGGPATLSMKTTYVGRDADDVRASLQGESREETERGYRDYYARLYPGIEPSRPLVVRDDEDANVLVTDEAYRLPQLWAMTEDETTWIATFRIPEIENVLVEPEHRERETPLALDHPRRVSHRLTIELPAHWDVDDEDVELESPAATFRREVRGTDRRIEVKSDWATSLDWIPAGEAWRHVDVVRQAFELSTFEITAARSGRPLAAGQEQEPQGANWSVLALAVVTLLSGIATGAGLSRSRSEASAPAHGLLIAHGAALPVLTAAWMVAGSEAFELSHWLGLTMPGSPAHVPWAAPLLLAWYVGVLFLSGAGIFLPIGLLRPQARIRLAHAACCALAVLLALLHLGLRLLVPTAVRPSAAWLAITMLVFASVGLAVQAVTSRRRRAS